MSSPIPIKIDRCVCKEISFRELLDMAALLGSDLDLLALSTGASIDCGTCRPWLALALERRQWCFEVHDHEVTNAVALRQHFGSGRCR